MELKELELEEDDNSTDIDTYGGCVCENYMLKLLKLHKSNKIPRYLVEISLYGERSIRKMARIDTFEGWRYADIITGSLYDPETGKCNSSAVKIVKVRKDDLVVKKKVAKKAVKKVAKKAVKKVAKKAVKKTTKAKK